MFSHSIIIGGKLFCNSVSFHYLHDLAAHLHDLLEAQIGEQPENRDQPPPSCKQVRSAFIPAGKVRNDFVQAPVLPQRDRGLERSTS